MKWYCVQTKPLKEAFAARYCEDVLSLATYVPMLVRQKTIRRVKRTVIRPLFPGYVFCRFSLDTHFRAVNYGPDVNGIVQSGGAPVEVSDTIIQGIQTWLAQDQQVERPVASPGEVVLITSGVMSGIEAVFVREMSDRERVEVLLSVLHCGARMIVSRDDVRRVS